VVKWYEQGKRTLHFVAEKKGEHPSMVDKWKMKRAFFSLLFLFLFIVESLIFTEFTALQIVGNKRSLRALSVLQTES